jgi:hypothetical protein
MRCWSLPSLLLAGAACARPIPAHTPAAIAPWLKVDPRRCLLVRDLVEGMEMMAKHCAEEFVRQNGYTNAPATEDSTRWVAEPGEGGSWPTILATRGGTLEPHATTSQCSMRQCVVLFRLRRHDWDCTYRIVTMSQVFTKLRLEPGGMRDIRCDNRRA